MFFFLRHFIIQVNVLEIKNIENKLSQEFSISIYSDKLKRVIYITGWRVFLSKSLDTIQY